MIGWAARRPAVAWATAAAVLLAGGVAFARLPLATKPQVELPRLQIGAQWPGASAELVEAYLTAPIEAAVQGVRGVRKISSQSDEGSTRLTVDLEERARVQLTRLAILERLELLRAGFPEGASAPSVGNYVPEALAEQPLLRYTLSGPYTAGTIERLARERITPRLAAVAGVAGVGVSGGAELGVAVAYDAARLRQLAISPDALAQAIGEARVRRALGEERNGASQRPVVLRDRRASLAAVADLPVRASQGRVFRLGDLAAVRLEEDSRDYFYRVNGEPAVGLTVSRLPGADAIRTAVEVRRTMAELVPQLPPGTKVRVQSDESEDLARQLVSLLLRGAIACAAVVLVLALALRNAKSVALVLASALVAIAGTALGLYLLRIPANLLTLAGLGMGIGILVQNGVVVADRLRAAPDTTEGRVEAGRRITPAVLGATLTTAVVLLPFLYLQGNARAAFTPFAVAFALALAWSIVSSVVMIPALGAGHGLRWVTWPRLLRVYARSVVIVLRWRWATLALAVGLMGFVGRQFINKVPRFSFGDWYGQRSYLYASLTFPHGSDPASLDQGMREFERVVMRRSGVEQVVSQGWRDGAQMQVTFARGADQTPVPYVLQEELTQRAILIGGATVAVQYRGPGYYSGTGAGGSQYRIKLLGYSYGGVEHIAQDLKRLLERIPRVRNVDVNAQRFWGQEKAFAITLEPDRAALARYGLTARDLAGTVAREVRGPVGSSERLEIDGHELQVTIKAAGARDRSLDELRAALVPNRAHAPVRLGDLARVDERQTLAQIDREDQQYVRTISYEFRGPPKLGDRTHKSFLASIAVPPGYSVGDDSFFRWGEDKSGKALWLVFAAGLMLVILAVAMVFDSVWASAQVFLSLPVALAGSAAAFWIAGAAFTREAAVGVILVVGLAVNQAILLVDAALERRRGEHPARRPLTGADVVHAARDRAGMILLVTFTTLASVLPLAVGTSPDELFGAIALATVGGTVAGTIGALWVVPALVVRVRKFTPILAALAIGAAGCGGDRRPGTWAGQVDTLPSGTVVVRNSNRGVWDTASAWHFVEELRIGSAEGYGPTSFNQIAALTVDPAGRIYVLERQAQEIRVFDSSGAFVRSIGRKGSGPAEFQEAIGMAWDPSGRLWVVDQRNVRYSVFDTAGRFVAEHPRPLSGFFAWSWDGGMDTAGTLYEMYAIIGPSRSTVLLALDSSLKVMDTLPLPSYDGEAYKIERPGMFVSATVPFTPSLVWSFDPRGYIWLGTTTPYRIYQARLRGDTVRIIERAHEPVPVTSDEKDSAVAGMKWFTDQGGKVDASRIPDVKPAFDGFFLDDRGYLWVEPVVKQEQGRAFDVFDTEGRYLGRVRSGFRLLVHPAPTVHGDRLYGLTEDENGIPYVVRARIAGR